MVTLYRASLFLTDKHYDFSDKTKKSVTFLEELEELENNEKEPRQTPNRRPMSHDGRMPSLFEYAVTTIVPVTFEGKKGDSCGIELDYLSASTSCRKPHKKTESRPPKKKIYGSKKDYTETLAKHWACCDKMPMSCDTMTMYMIQVGIFDYFSRTLSIEFVTSLDA
jgi:hypothetical protein